MRGRPKGSKNKPKVVANSEATPAPRPAPATDQDFDQLQTLPAKRSRESARSPSKSSQGAGKVNDSSSSTPSSSSPKKRVLQNLDSAKNDRLPEKPVLTVRDEEEADDPDEPSDDEQGQKTVRIIRLGTEEVKKYAIFTKKTGEEEDSDDDDYDREDREISFVHDDETGETSQEMEEWLDNYTEREPEETSLKVAKKYPSKQTFPCPKCPKIWNWPWELRRHLMIHFKPQKFSEKNSYKCPDCNKKFQWKRDMKQHERIHSGEKVLVCSVCEKKFTTRQALLHHVVVHTGEKPFQCAVCGNKFTQPANLRTHVKKKHNYNFETNKQNKCEYCGEPHVSIVGLHQHLLEDHPQQVQEERELLAREKAEKAAEKERKEKEREQKRMKKEQSTRRKARLKEWEMDYEFYIGDGLVRGVDWDRTPSNGEIACGQCDRKFGWRYEIMFHGLCHLMDEQGNAKNKICPECDTPFKVPIGLKHHLISHTGETPFLCLHCWKSWKSHIDLKLHIKKEHLMHLNSKVDKAGENESTPKKNKDGKNNTIEDEPEVEEQTSHYVQLEDGTYAEMVEGHEIVKPGQQMLVRDEQGKQLVVVNPSYSNAQQAIVIPEQAETVYVIASQNGPSTDSILPDNLDTILTSQEGLEMIVEENGDKKYIMDVRKQENSIILGVAD